MHRLWFLLDALVDALALIFVVAGVVAVLAGLGWAVFKAPGGAQLCAIIGMAVTVSGALIGRFTGDKLDPEDRISHRSF